MREDACARLIRLAGVTDKKSLWIVSPDDYDEVEVRVANESLKRVGSRASIMIGTLGPPRVTAICWPEGRPGLGERLR